MGKHIRSAVTAMMGVALVTAGTAPAVASDLEDGDVLTLLTEPVIGPVDRTFGVGPDLDLGDPHLSGTGDSTGSLARSSTRQNSPNRCSGSTDFPHRSRQQASVHARISCARGPVQRLETVTVLTRDRWFGPEQVAAGSSWTTGQSTSHDAHPHWTCTGVGTYTYRGYSQHASLEGGTIYRSSTSNWQVPGMSRFAC